MENLENVNSLKSMFSIAVKNHRSGNVKEAKKLYYRILQFSPENPDVLHYLGLIENSLGNSALAINLINKASIIKNNDSEIFYNLGDILFLEKRFSEAESYFRKALKLKPEWVEANMRLANILFNLHKWQNLIDTFDELLKVRPEWPEILFNKGCVLENTGNFQKASECYTKALKINPEYFEAITNLGNASSSMGKNAEAIDYYRKALSIKPEYYRIHSNILLGMQYLPELSQREWKIELDNFNSSFSKIPKITFHKNGKDLNKRLKIGYVSPDFRNHPCAFFIEPLLIEHDHKNFEIFCYSQTTETDHVTERFQRNTDRWAEINSLSDKELTDIIIQDEIDILVDLAGHTENNRLSVFAAKASPIQINWLGFPASTGLNTIDYKISDHFLTPKNTNEYFSEKIWNLNCPAHCFMPPEKSPSIETLPYLKNGYITFGSFNNLRKVSFQTIELWSKVLSSVPESKILLKSKQTKDYEVKKIITEMFSNNGIKAERIIFAEQNRDYFDHLAFYNNVDIALDTFPYNGATTTMEALWMGVPVISLFGDRSASRYGLSFLNGSGLAELTTDKRDEFIQITVNLANNKEKLAAIRLGLRNKLLESSLLDKEAFTSEMESAYRKMWVKYCFNKI